MPRASSRPSGHSDRLQFPRDRGHQEGQQQPLEVAKSIFWGTSMFWKPAARTEWNGSVRQQRLCIQRHEPFYKCGRGPVRNTSWSTNGIRAEFHDTLRHLWKPVRRVEQHPSLFKTGALGGTHRIPG